MSTNKTELLRCPFCGSEALHYDNAYATCGKYRCPMNGVVVKNESWNTRAAPAEDIRAVGEEPVAYELLFNGEQVDVVGKQGFPPASLEVYDRNGYTSGRLYRHPQREVVLPERMEPRDPYDSESNQWNACINEFERLNK